MNNNIRGIVIDAGHGGEDPGAIGNGIIEKDLTLKISNYMANRFKDLGIPVILTRDTDITLSPTERTNKVKNAFGNYSDVIVISNHINAGGGDGAEVIYALRNDATLSNNILDELAKTGQNIRGSYQRKSLVNPNNDYYFMQRNTGNTESITVEYGFLDSNKDDVYQLKNNWQIYADAVVQGVLNYINNNPLDSSYYIVKRGDSLYSIANKYGITVNEIKQLNGLTTNNLYIGQRIKLPIIDNDYYIVKNGDTLYSIAKKYNMSVIDIKRINNLTNDNLYVGQKLNINNNNYIVKSGDTLYSIAKRYGVTVDEIKNKNNIVGNILFVGQELII